MSLTTLRPRLGLALALSLAVPACEENPVAEICDLTCPEEGLLDGNASISGIASVDSFFSAVVGFGKAALEVRAGVDAELRAIAVSLELDAAAKCDASIDPGSASVECKGTCTVDASASASCDASATVVCKGTAPQLQCSGTCTGTCELSGDLQCAGTCNGDCNGTCSVTGPDGKCAGECMGQCAGTCELRAGATCDGNCQGSCEYEAPDGQCEAGAEVRCRAAADASATCDGSCDGEVTPPKASAQCEASVDAEAKLRAECTPPTLEIGWQWSAELQDPVARAEFKAWVEGFRARYAALLAASARAQLVLAAASGLGDAALSLTTSLPAAFADNDEIRVKLGLSCAVAEFAAVPDVLADASAALTGSVSAVAEVSGALAGG